MDGFEHEGQELKEEFLEPEGTDPDALGPEDEPDTITVPAEGGATLPGPDTRGAASHDADPTAKPEGEVQPGDNPG